jgi:iron complex outermembrane receptor protein
MFMLGMVTIGQSASAQLASSSAPSVQADNGQSDVEEIIVTGTRETGIRAGESPSPIQFIAGDRIATTGVPNLSQELTRLVPSFSSPNFGGDTAALTTAAVLRGLSPNHVLVLVNGKRRNASANILADAGPNQGSNPIDLDLIPAAAIDHIEVLTDGAAAQYGSDAIAGVINIILKNADNGGSVSATAGENYGSPFDEVHKTGDGFTLDNSGNVGIPLGDSGFLNLSAEYKHHDNSNVSGPDLRGAAGGVPADPFQSRIIGDPESSLENVVFNAGIDLDTIELYSTGTYSHRHAKAFENYRTETKAAGLTLPDGVPLPNPYPLGFNPAEILTQDYYSLTVGAKGEAAGWNWDLSSTYGADNDNFGNVGGLNIQLYQATGSSPTVFHTGNLKNSEWTNNLNFIQSFEIGLAEPLSVAFGGESRHETYELDAGDPASRFGAGSQANPGFSLTDARNVYRDSGAGYVDLATKIAPDWKIDVAGRFEHYSDSGNTKIGKISTRYDFSPELGIRATVSNGFRAPSLAQQSFSSTNVAPGFALAQLPVDSPGARSLGAIPLKPEISNNYSVGFVAEPVPRLHVSVDAYQINIRNRIIDTGDESGPAAVRAIEENGNVLEPGDLAFAEFFTNALTTHTRGVDVSASYPESLGDYGSVDWSISANFNNTVALVTAANAQRFAINASALSYLTTASPHTKIILDAAWTDDPWDVNLRGTFYGGSSTIDLNGNTGQYFDNHIDPAFIVDLEVGYTLGAWHLAAGANNIFNTFPNKVNPLGQTPLNAEIYNTNSPYGYQGGYYYGRATYSF